MKKNPYPLIVPCHRVIKSSGELGCYSGGGKDVKAKLLSHEKALPSESIHLKTRVGVWFTVRRHTRWMYVNVKEIRPPNKFTNRLIHVSIRTMSSFQHIKDAVHLMLRQFCFEKKIKTLFLWDEGLFSSSYSFPPLIHLLIEWCFIHPTQRTRASDSDATARSRIRPDTDGTDYQSFQATHQTIECWVCITSLSVLKPAHLHFYITVPDWWTSFHSSPTRSRLSEIVVCLNKRSRKESRVVWVPRDSHTWIGGAELLSADRTTSLCVVCDAVQCLAFQSRRLLIIPFLSCCITMNSSPLRRTRSWAAGVCSGDSRCRTKPTSCRSVFSQRVAVYAVVD